MTLAKSHSLLPSSGQPQPHAMTVTGHVTIVVCPHPFSTIKHIYHVPCQGSIVTCLLHIGCHIRAGTAYHICLNGTPLDRDQWLTTFPAPNQLLTVRCLPQGGGGKSGGKGGLGFIIAGLAIVAAVFTFGLSLAAGSAFALGAGLVKGALLKIAASATAYSLLKAGIGLVAVGVLGLLSPHNAPQPPSLAVPGRVSTLTGIRNQANPYGTIPRPMGTHRMFPPFAAVPYTEIQGDDQFLVCLFCLGYGPLDVSQLKIGETDLDHFDDVQHVVHYAHSGDTYRLQYYTHDVFEEALSISLTKYVETHSHDSTDDFEVRTTGADTTRISVDIGFPEGVIVVSSDGSQHIRHLHVWIYYRKTGTETWLKVGVKPHGLTAKTRTPKRINVQWSVTAGQYDVAVGRASPYRNVEADAARREFWSNEITWDVLRSFRNTPPVRTTKNLVLVELKIRATDQLSGTLNSFNCIVKSEVTQYDGSSWSLDLTQNPAWCFASVVTDEANALAVSTSRLDEDSLSEWAEWCDTHGFRYNKILDTKTTVFEQLQEIASAGRAMFRMAEGKFSILRDIPQTTPVQIFTPRNSADYRGEKVFVSQRPHALRIQYVNELRGYTDDERIVYDDGYDEQSATIFETLPFPGVTHPDQAWKNGRYFLAQARLRPEVHYISTDIEHLTCTRGDLVEMVQDAINLGVGSARIQALTFSGTDLSSLTIDTMFPLADDTDYAVVIRRTSDGERLALNVTVPANETETNTLTLDPALSTSDDQPAIGDLVLFGVRESVTGRFIIKSIEHGGDETATLGLVAEAPTLQDADITDIPLWDPQITRLTNRERERPPLPQIWFDSF